MKVEFASELDVRALGAGRWRLLADFVCLVDGRRFTVPAGFETDFASVPRLPLAFLLVGDVAHKAPVLHDYLYTINAGREFADQAFRAALAAEGIDAARRALMYAGVRIGGQSAYATRSMAEVFPEQPSP